MLHFDGAGDYPLDIVGESNYQDVLEAICGGKTYDGHHKTVNAVLVYENSNPYDDKAIMVLINDRKVGYLSRTDARYYRKKMAKAGFAGRPAECAAIIAGGWNRGDHNQGHFGVKLDLPIKPIEKRKNYWLLLIIPLGLFGYVAAGPYITMQQIRIGIYEQGHERLSENIDFPPLRANLKEQINAIVIKQAASTLKDNPFAALGNGVRLEVVEGMVDSFATPSGLASLMAGKKPQQVQGGVQPQESSGQKLEPFKNARYTYDSPSKFSVWVKDDKGAEIRFVLIREGLSWKLSNIIVPMDS